MIYFRKRIAEVTPADISTLVSNQVSESRVLEYKQELLGFSQGEKKEFLADVSSFANTQGGTILYGVSEARDNEGNHLGFPSEIIGITITPDDIQRLENVIRDGLDPRVPAVEFRAINLDSSKTILVVDIPRSLGAPHVVWFDRNGKFWARNSAGKYQMDVTEIRRAVLERQSWQAEAEALRDQQLEMSRDILKAGLEQGKAILGIHALPLGSNREVVHLQDQWELAQRFALHPDFLGVQRYNLEGIYKENKVNTPTSFLQLYRNGAVLICFEAPLMIRDDRRVSFEFLDGPTLYTVVKNYIGAVVTVLRDSRVSPPSGHLLDHNKCNGKACYRSTHVLRLCF